MEFAESYATLAWGHLGGAFDRANDLGEVFSLRWGSIGFDVQVDFEINLKVILKIYRSDGVCEQCIVDTEVDYGQDGKPCRVTRDFYVQPFPSDLGRVTAVKVAFVVHVGECFFNSSIVSNIPHL